jgi:hypothetical protein
MHKIAKVRLIELHSFMNRGLTQAV